MALGLTWYGKYSVSVSYYYYYPQSAFTHRPLSQVVTDMEPLPEPFTEALAAQLQRADLPVTRWQGRGCGVKAWPLQPDVRQLCPAWLAPGLPMD